MPFSLHFIKLGMSYTGVYFKISKQVNYVIVLNHPSKSVCNQIHNFKQPVFQL